MNSLNPEKRSQPSRLSHFLLNFSIAHTHMYTHSRSLALLHAHTPFFSFFPYPQTRLLTLTHALSFSLSHSLTITHTRTKGAGNIEYGDIENWEIEKTGTSKMKQREYREKNNGNIEIKIENGEIENVVRNPFLNNTSIPVC
jgi:hypothetical protein